MANSNTIAAIYNSPKQTINATAETVLLNKAGTPVVVGLAAQANVDGGRVFSVRIRGVATGGTGALLTIKLYVGTSATVGSNAACGAFTVSGAAIPVGGGQFNLVATLSWDSVSGTLHGQVGGNTNGTVTTAAGTSVVSSLTSPAALQFVASATFGAALATNSVTLTEFSIEQE